MTEGGAAVASLLFLMRYPLEKGDNLKIKFDVRWPPCGPWGMRRG